MIVGTISISAQNCEGPLTVKMIGASSSMPITIDEESTSVYCTAASEGMINITVYGGTPTYDYQWAHENTNQNFLVDLPVGSYYVTVTDANGCQEERTITIVNVDPLTDSLDLIDVSACGSCYLHDGTQSFFYFEEDYIGAIVDLTTDRDLGTSMMCAEVNDDPCICQSDASLGRKWCFKTDSIENANVRLFFTAEELTELAIYAGYSNGVEMINSGNCYLQIYEFDKSDCEKNLPIRTLDQSQFSMTRFDDEKGVWSLEVRGLDDVCVVLSARGATLPLDFLTFDGEALAKVNRLYWTTANEQNNHGFVIEKSKMGLSFDSIGFVLAQDVIEPTYTFDDRNPWSGSNFYRLRQIDFDGKIDYSHIIHLQRKADFDFRIIENPFRQTLYIEVATNVAIDANISIFAVDGRIVRTQDINLVDGIRNLEYNLDDLPPGNYMVRFYNKTSNEFLTKKVVKI